jgi:hypothetical protein
MFHLSKFDAGLPLDARPRTGVAPSQCRPCQPRPTEGHVGHRELPHGGSRRACRAHQAGRIQFFGEHARLAERDAFTAYLAPSRKAEWVVYSKRPFGGPEAVLAYLSRYTHRVAIANSRLIALDDAGVTFRWKDYRAKGRERAKVMTLAVDEFIRRFLVHVLPDGFHRIRHYGLFANGGRAENIARARQLLDVPAPQSKTGDAAGANDSEPEALAHLCPCCGGRMIIIETFERGCTPQYHPTAPIPIDSS